MTSYEEVGDVFGGVLGQCVLWPDRIVLEQLNEKSYLRNPRLFDKSCASPSKRKREIFIECVDTSSALSRGDEPTGIKSTIGIVTPTKLSIETSVPCDSIDVISNREKLRRAMGLVGQFHVAAIAFVDTLDCFFDQIIRTVDPSVGRQCLLAQRSEVIAFVENVKELFHCRHKDTPDFELQERIFVHQAVEIFMMRMVQCAGIRPVPHVPNPSNHRQTSQTCIVSGPTTPLASTISSNKSSRALKILQKSTPSSLFKSSLRFDPSKQRCMPDKSTAGRARDESEWEERQGKKLILEPLDLHSLQASGFHVVTSEDATSTTSSAAATIATPRHCNHATVPFEAEDCTDLELLEWMDVLTDAKDSFAPILSGEPSAWRAAAMVVAGMPQLPSAFSPWGQLGCSPSLSPLWGLDLTADLLAIAHDDLA